MITTFWAAGVGMTLLMFACKVGLAAGSLNLRTTRLAASALGYGVLVFIAGAALTGVASFDYFTYFQRFTVRGVLVHFFLSLGLLAWGLFAMRSVAAGGRTDRSHGMLLLIPCPVCLVAMFLGCAIVSVLSGIDPIATGSGIGVLFSGIILITGLIARAGVRRQAGFGRMALLAGFPMALTGLYLIVATIVVTLYKKAGEVVAATDGISAGTGYSPREAVLLIIVVAVIFGLGFLQHRKQTRKTK